MKKMKLLLLFLFLINPSAFADAFFQSDFMSAAEAEKKWGKVELDLKKFKDGDPTKRSTMAVDIVKRQLYVGKEMKAVRQDGNRSLTKNNFSTDQKRLLR